MLPPITKEGIMESSLTFDKAELDIGQETKTLPLTRFGLKTELAPKTDLFVPSATKLREMQKVKQQTAPILKVAQKVSPAQKTLVVPRARPSIAQRPTPPKPTTTRIPYIKLPPRPKGVRATRRPARKTEQAYITKVKKGGKWVSRGPASTKGGALRRGAKIARETAVASFKVVPTKGKVKAKGNGFTPSTEVFRGYKVVKGKQVKMKDTYIQKRRTRIGTPGELREITKKGISKRKQKAVNFFK